MLSLALLFGAYAIADGVFGIVSAARSARAGERWGWLVFEGLSNFAIATIAFFWPGITILTETRIKRTAGEVSLGDGTRAGLAVDDAEIRANGPLGSMARGRDPPVLRILVDVIDFQATSG